MSGAAITQNGGAVTIATARMLAATYRACLDGIARRRRDGAPTDDLRALAVALYRAHELSRSRHLLDADPRTVASCDRQHGADLISVAEAAAILSVSKRTVQRLAASGVVEGVRVGRSIWALDRGAVQALKTVRERRAT